MVLPIPESTDWGTKGTRIFSLKAGTSPLLQVQKSHSPLRQIKESLSSRGRGYSFHGIPFSLADQPVYTMGTEVAEAHEQLAANRYSNGGNYSYEWLKLNDFPKQKLIHDFRDRDQSAVEAANLIVQSGDGTQKMPLIGNKLPELYSAAAKLLRDNGNVDTLA